MKTTQIGTITFEAEMKFGESFESAAAYLTVSVEPGTYPVEVADNEGRVGSSSCSRARWIRIPLPGTIVASGYGAKAYSEKGQEHTLQLRPYRYELEKEELCGGRLSLTKTPEEIKVLLRGSY